MHPRLPICCFQTRRWHCRLLPCEISKTGTSQCRHLGLPHRSNCSLSTSAPSRRRRHQYLYLAPLDSFGFVFPACLWSTQQVCSTEEECRLGPHAVALSSRHFLFDPVRCFCYLPIGDHVQDFERAHPQRLFWRCLVGSQPLATANVRPYFGWSQGFCLSLERS